MKLYDVQEEEEYEHAVPFKIRNPIFVNDTAKENFEIIREQLLGDVVGTGKALQIEPQENEENSVVFQNLCYLPENQQKSALSKVRKIAFFQLGKSQEPSDRFKDTLSQKLINLYYADLVKKPLRISRDKNQWSGNGCYAKFNMDYDEFFVIDDLLSVIGLVEQHIPTDGYKEEEHFQTRVQLTDYGRNIFNNYSNSIVSFNESEKDFQEVVMTKPVTKKVKDSKTGRSICESFNVPVPYVKSDKIKRIINRIQRINSLYQGQQLTIRLQNIELPPKEVNKLLANHIDGKIQINELVYFSPYGTNVSHSLNTRIINNINTISFTSGYGNTIQVEGDTAEVNRAGGGIKGNNSILYQYNNDIHCQSDSGTVLIKTMELELLDKRVHRVFSRECQSLHGRHYGYWNTMNKILRSGVYLNDSSIHMVSLDFRAMHQTLAYHLNKLPCDASSIYNIDLQGKTLIKDIALVAMNVKRSKKRPYQGALQAIKNNACEKHCVTHPEAKEAFYGFINRHSAIEDYVCSDFGVKGMFYDSLIMEDCLYELMIKNGIVVLPVHDELLCPADKVAEVKDQMIKSYRKILKRALVDSGVLGRNDPLPEHLTPVIG